MPKGDMGGSGDGGQTTVGKKQRKYKPSEVGFRKNQGFSGLRCGDCYFFENAGCRIVAISKVSADDVCGQFEPDPSRGNMSSRAPGTRAEVKRQKPMAVHGLLRRVGPAIATYELLIKKVSTDKQTGVKRWLASSSGVSRDLYNERMSIELFRDFIKRVENREEVPEPFSSDAWNGGLPYLGIAHYLDLDGYGIAGDTEQMYVDGSLLKARGTFRDTEVGNAAYWAIKRDFEEKLPHNERVRVSIAFIDWAHEHEGQGIFKRRSLIEACQMCEEGVGEKIYRSGHLVHKALTRRPAYPTTSISLEA